MNLIDAITQRKSVRAFLKKDVEIEKIKTILDTAKHAPSGVNMQPWKVYVVEKLIVHKIRHMLIELSQNFKNLFAKFRIVDLVYEHGNQSIDE